MTVQNKKYVLSISANRVSGKVVGSGFTGAAIHITFWKCFRGATTHSNCLQRLPGVLLSNLSLRRSEDGFRGAAKHVIFCKIL